MTWVQASFTTIFRKKLLIPATYLFHRYTWIPSIVTETTEKTLASVGKIANERYFNNFVLKCVCNVCKSKNACRNLFGAFSVSYQRFKVYSIKPTVQKSRKYNEIKHNSGDTCKCMSYVAKNLCWLVIYFVFNALTHMFA